MNESPSLIPKSRQVKQVSHMNDNAVNNPLVDSSGADNGMNVQYIEPKDRFVTGS